MELVKVYEHKKIMINNEVKSMLKIAYITYADVKNDTAILENPKGKSVKKISRQMSDIENEDYIFDEVNTSLIKFGDDSLSETDILEKAEKYLLGMYYEIYEESGILIGIKEIFDDKIREQYDQGVVPSLSNQLNSLMSNMESGRLVLNQGIVSQLIGKSNSLEQQDTNTNKSMMDYDIKEIYKELKEIVIGQDAQLKVFLANIIKNISLSYSELDVEVIKRLKSNILLIGPTGTGKTLMIESLAKVLDIPYIICDANRYTSNGYVGEDIENILVDLYHTCNEDMERFEHGIIFIDEFDKLCEVKDEKSHVTTTDVQASLLKLLDGTVVNKTLKRGLSEEHLSFDTSRIIFVLSGAFTKIFENEKIISEKVLKENGLISEILGRIKTTIVLNKPSKEDLKQETLHGKFSYLKMFNNYLKTLGVDYTVSDDFIDYVVDLAFTMDLGYRGLEKIISSYIDEYLFDIISGDNKKLIYTITKKISD